MGYLVQGSAVLDRGRRKFNVRVEGLQLVEDRGRSSVQRVGVRAVGTSEECGLDLRMSAAELIKEERKVLDLPC